MKTANDLGLQRNDVIDVMLNSRFFGQLPRFFIDTTYFFNFGPHWERPQFSRITAHSLCINLARIFPLPLYVMFSDSLCVVLTISLCIRIEARSIRISPIKHSFIYLAFVVIAPPLLANLLLFRIFCSPFSVDFAMTGLAAKPPPSAFLARNWEVAKRLFRMTYITNFLHGLL